MKQDSVIKAVSAIIVCASVVGIFMIVVDNNKKK